MITEERLDQLIRASLSWEARRVAAAQPSLADSARRAAQRLGPSAIVLRPRLTLAPATAGGLNLLVMIALLLALAAAAVFVGSLLLRSNLPNLRPGPFGFAAECIETGVPHTGLVFDEPSVQVLVRAVAPDGPDADEELDDYSLYADGRLVHDLSDPGETRVDNVSGAQLVVRRLSAGGVSAVLGRISGAGLSPGCRVLRTEDSSGQLEVWLPEGYAEAAWGPNVRYGTNATEEQAQALDELVADVVHPESWLPDDAWLDREGEAIRPHHWLISINLPGQDPPAPSSPGMPYVDLPLPDGSTLRCAEASDAEAVAVARRQEFFPANEQVQAASIQPVFGEGFDCADLAATRRFNTAPQPSASPRPIVGELAGIGPCALVPAGAAAIVEGDSLTELRSKFAIGVPARACFVVNSADAADYPADIVDPYPPAGYRAALTLHPYRLTAEDAEAIVSGALGVGLSRTSDDGALLWTNSCQLQLGPEYETPPHCIDITAAWAAGHLVVFEFSSITRPDPAKPGTMTSEWLPVITDESARMFVDAVVASLREL